MTPEERKRFLNGLEKARPVVHAFMAIDDVIILKTAISASLDTWCMQNGYDPVEVIDSISDAIHTVYTAEDEE